MFVRLSTGLLSMTHLKFDRSHFFVAQTMSSWSCPVPFELYTACGCSDMEKPAQQPLRYVHSPQMLPTPEDPLGFPQAIASILVGSVQLWLILLQFYDYICSANVIKASWSWLSRYSTEFAAKSWWVHTCTYTQTHMLTYTHAHARTYACTHHTTHKRTCTTPTIPCSIATR